MDTQLYKIAVQACADVYHDNIDLGTTEYKLTTVKYQGYYIDVLAIAGSNEHQDWFKNFNLWSTKGIKKVAYDAAQEITQTQEIINRLQDDRRLLVCGHSKAGPTAIAYKREFGADWCIAFCPARSLRYWSNRKMDNTSIFIDPDDIVPKLAFLSFGHPICNKVILPNDLGWDISDHFLDNIINYLNQEL